MYLRGTARALQYATDNQIRGVLLCTSTLGIAGSTIWTRGAKRKTTINIADLPQGVLPSLPKLEDTTEKSYPPVLQQHLNNVRKFEDCIVLTRVGDFYEMYFDQVDEYAPLVGLKKAKRYTALGDVAMAGFQHTQIDRYLKMFVQDLGKQVAISEQIRLPEHERATRTGAAMYDRRVTRVITPGTLIDESFITPFEKNFLLAIHFDEAVESTKKRGSGIKVGLAWIDLSSGDFQLQTAQIDALHTLIARIGPREIVLDSRLQSHGATQLQKVLGEQAQSLSFHDITDATYNETSDWSVILEEGVSIPQDVTTQETAAGNLLLGYVSNRVLDAKIKLQPPVRRSESDYMSIDKQSLRALEIKSTLRDGLQQGSLLHTIRRTVTNSGARLLSQRIVSPSMSLDVINKRLDLVQAVLENAQVREDITTLLRDTSDTSRLLQKFSIGKGDAEDMLGIAKTIKLTSSMADVLQRHIIMKEHSQSLDLSSADESLLDVEAMRDILHRLDLVVPEQLSQSILSAIDEDSLSQKQRIEIEKAEQSEKLATEVAEADAAGEEAPKLARRMLKAGGKSSQMEDQDVWIMRKAASPALRQAHKRLDTLLDQREDLAVKLRTLLTTDSLTLRWSPQHGHFCHVKGKDTKKALNDLRGARSFASTKSTRWFYAPDWTALGHEIDSAKQLIRSEEDKVFTKLKAHVFENLMMLRRNATVLDELDVACSSAVIAQERGLVRPILNEGVAHHIIGGRHPTVDVGLQGQGKQFTANDCSVGKKELIYLITGPNMAGKSTYLRQNALITILAQTGCYVPAQYAEIGLVDKIFSRVGSADSLYQDQSTFMVEMLETATILQEATPRSFVIMDEVGRGTTPQDGVAVGYACLHHLHHVNQCRSLFATHFHTLADMTEAFDKLSCHCTDVAEESDGSWMYIHKLKPGVNRQSHALKVARLAGLPQEAINVAARVLGETATEAYDDRLEGVAAS